MTVHGGKPGDQQLLQDGMNYNSLEPGGTGRILHQPGTASNSLEQGAGNAEYSGGGVNVIWFPRRRRRTRCSSRAGQPRHASQQPHQTSRPRV
jgi:hypothetical protein